MPNSKIDFTALLAEFFIGSAIGLILILVLAASVRPLEFVYQGY